MFNTNEDTKIIAEENKQLRKKNKYSQREIDEINAEKEELARKYIEILEEKSNGFNEYLKYQELYNDAYTTVKAQKREIAELKEEIKQLTEEIEKINNSKSKKGGKNEK